ncbi:MAG TPA: tetratricopeptide repeat protein [Candidatus Polarisedimenticolia bacterium]|nr:tetratricopeptide repeat protein [Candidatus Polarisedimenticolia bacterium]
MALTDISGIVRNLTQSAEERAIARALQHFSKGQIDKAIAVLKEAQQKSPDDPAVLLELGRLLAYAQKGIESAEAFRALLRRDPRALPKVEEALEELKARHASVGPQHDAIAEHHLHRDDIPRALKALERMRPEDLRAVLPRHQSKYEQVRRGAKDGKLTKTILLPAYHAALIHETLKDVPRALTVYRDIARTNPEEAGRILPRLETIAARDYQNAELRLEIAALLIDAGRADDAAKQFGLALETNPRSAPAIAEAVSARIDAAGEAHDLRWVLVSALLAAGDEEGGREAMRPLIAAGNRLDDIIAALQPLTQKEKSAAAHRLLAEAFLKRGQPVQAIGPLLQAAEEEGLASVQVPLEALVAAHPDLPRPHQLLADLHLEAGRAAEAVASLVQAHRLAPKESSALAPRLTKALQIDATSPDAHRMLADLLAEASEHPRAVIVLRHWLGVAPGEAAQVLERLSRLAAESGDPRAALGASEASILLTQHEAALALLEPVVAQHPELSAEFLHALGLLAERAPGLAPRLIALFETLEPRSPLPVAVHFARGLAQFAAGMSAAAAASFREVLQSAPDRVEEVRQALERFDRSDAAAAEARYLLASIYVDRRDHEAAVRELRRPGPTHAALLDRVLKRYESIVKQTPDDLPARAGLMETLLLARRHDRALEVGKETLKIRDDASTARVSLLMADALVEKRDSDGAVRRFYAAYRRDPSLGPLVIERLRRLLDAEGKHPFTCLVLGKVLASQGRSEEALEVLKAARAGDPALNDSVLLEIEGLVRACPADPRPGLALLALLKESGQHARAVQVISSHLDSHPDSAQRIAAYLDEIVRSQPDHPLAHYELGRALMHLNARARAADRFRTAAQLDPALAPMALRRLQEILIADPTCVIAWMSSAEVLEHRGQALQAAERLAEAIARAPQDAESLLGRLEQLCRSHPDEGPMQLLFADASLRLGEHDRAVRAYGDAAARDLDGAAAALRGLDAILEASPRHPEARVMRARARLRLSQSDAALTDLSEAAHLAPRLLPDVLTEIESLVDERPAWAEGAILRADLLVLSGRPREAESLLQQRVEKTTARPARLQMRLRLARCASERQDEAAARAHLKDAATLATDRNEFLGRVHELHLAGLRRRLAAARERLERGEGSAADLESAALACLDLGRSDEANALVAAHAPAFEQEDSLRRLRAALTLFRGDFPRAADLLRPLGASAPLAFGALRGGDYPLAIETLETLATRDADPRTRRLLERTYRDMVAADLFGGSRRLVAETFPAFGEGAAV